MRSSQLATLVFILLAAFAAIHFSQLYPQLPGTVASHFDAHGRANGWQSKSSFLAVFVGVSVLSAVIGFGIPRVLTVIPVQIINLPNKEYWLAPERRAESLDFLAASFAWLGCGMYAFVIFVFDYSIQATLHPQHPPEISRILYSGLAFVAWVLFWIVRLLAHFGRVRQSWGPVTF